MDEETGEEFTKTIWVDEAGNEVPEGGGGGAAVSGAGSERQVQQKSFAEEEGQVAHEAQTRGEAGGEGGHRRVLQKGVDIDVYVVARD